MANSAALRTSPRNPRGEPGDVRSPFPDIRRPEGGVALTARLSAFREELARRKLTGFVIPRADQQQNEYVAPSEERLAWLTGFTGSAGMAIVLTQEAAVFVDGRYTLQAAKQVDRKAWHVEPLADPPPENWLAKHLAAGDRLGFDPWLHTSAAAERLAGGLRQGRRGTGRGRQQPARFGVDRAPAAAARPGRRSRHAIFRRNRSRKAASGSGSRSQASASMRWCCRIRMRWPGPSTSAAPTSRIRRCRCPTRWCRRTAGPPCSSTTASFPTAPRDHLEQSADVEEPEALTPKLTELAQARRRDRARQRHRGRRAEPPDQRPPAASRCAATIPSACSRR